MKLRLQSATPRPLWILALTLFLLTPPLGAQEDVPAGPGEETGSEETVQVPAELASARATVQTFLEAFDDSKRREGMSPLQQAASTVDVSHLRSDVQQVQAEETAWQLKQILDRTERIDFDALSDEPRGHSMDPGDPGRWRRRSGPGRGRCLALHPRNRRRRPPHAASSARPRNCRRGH